MREEDTKHEEKLIAKMHAAIEVYNTEHKCKWPLENANISFNELHSEKPQKFHFPEQDKKARSVELKGTIEFSPSTTSDEERYLLKTGVLPPEEIKVLIWQMIHEDGTEMEDSGFFVLEAKFGAQFCFPFPTSDAVQIFNLLTELDKENPTGSLVINPSNMDPPAMYVTGLTMKGLLVEGFEVNFCHQIEALCLLFYRIVANQIDHAWDEYWALVDPEQL